MSWLGLRTRNACHFDLGGLQKDRQTPAAAELAGPDALLRGTLLLECAATPDGPRHTLLQIPLDQAGRWLAIEAVPDLGFLLILADGNSTRHAILRWQPTGRSGSLRVSYTWDLAGQSAALRLDVPGSLRAIHIPAPIPYIVQASVLARAFIAQDLAIPFPALSYFALADGLSPVGPMPGLGADTPLETPEGPKPIKRVRRGDLVLTSGGDSVPVLHVIRALMPACGSFAPMRLRAPTFGLRDDICVAPYQPVALHGRDVEYGFGRDCVLAQVCDVVAREGDACGPLPVLQSYYQLVLPEPAILQSAGAGLASLNIGRIRRDAKALRESVLGHLPARDLPEHAGPAHPILEPHESLALQRWRVA